MTINYNKIAEYLTETNINTGIASLLTWLEVEWEIEGIALLIESPLSESYSYLASSQDPGVYGLQLNLELPETPLDESVFIENNDFLRNLSHLLDMEVENEECALLCRLKIPGSVANLVVVMFGVKSYLEAVDFTTAVRFMASSIRNSLNLNSRKEITNRIKLDEILEEAHFSYIETYRELFENSSDGIFILDNDNKIIYLNKSAESMTGYNFQSLSHRNITEIVALHSKNIFSVKSDDLPQFFDMDITTTSNEIVCMGVSRSNLLSENGLTVLVCRDVTETKVVEERLRETADFLINLIDNSVVAIVSMEIHKNITLFNPAAETLFGYEHSEVVNKINIMDLFYNPEHWFMIIKRLSEPMESANIKHFRTSMLNSRSEEIPVSISAFLVPGIDSHPPNTVLFITDMRTQVELEEKLSIYQQKLAEQEKQAMISELAGALAHELNQPLMSILGYSQLLSNPSLGREKFERAVNHIANESERMAEIVKRIGNITRFETRKYVGQAKIVDLLRSSDE
ncbi:MAG: PAS domain S-box protein [Deltaproteobacteria bacterium]|nr:PAS domain S-box protein [Deltaproteobacteria bacterium]